MVAQGSRNRPSDIDPGGLLTASFMQRTLASTRRSPSSIPSSEAKFSVSSMLALQPGSAAKFIPILAMSEASVWALGRGPGAVDR